jgi:hypothetical protein
LRADDAEAEAEAQRDGTPDPSPRYGRYTSQRAMSPPPNTRWMDLRWSRLNLLLDGRRTQWISFLEIVWNWKRN